MSEKYDALKKREQAAIFNTYGRYPLAVGRASGCRLYDLDGREYVDLLAGIAVNALGHGRKDLAEVMAGQAMKLVHVSNLFTQEEQVVLAEKLLATCGADKVFFCNSGAEANEAAIKLARRYTRKIKGRDAGEIITLEGSFHGRTLATVTATGQPGLQDGFAPLPGGFRSVPFNDLCALRDAVSDQTAAVMLELVQGESGIRPVSREYVDGLLALKKEKDILIIVDEVQTGLCRTGSFWAHQLHNFVPDIFTSAKALANGLPMGAMFATDEVARGFVPGSHATTFGGGAVLAAVASRVVDVMVEEDLAGRAREMGEYAHGLFLGLVEKHPEKITSLRHVGLMLGIELAFPGQPVHARLLERGFVTNLAHGNVIRLLPPLVIEKADIASFASAMDEILAEIKA